MTADTNAAMRVAGLERLIEILRADGYTRRGWLYSELHEAHR